MKWRSAPQVGAIKSIVVFFTFTFSFCCDGIEGETTIKWTYCFLEYCNDGRRYQGIAKKVWGSQSQSNPMSGFPRPGNPDMEQDVYKRFP